MDEQQFREFVGRQTWIYSKRYAAFAPHEYIVRGEIKGTDEEFVKAIEYIRSAGIRMFYYKHERKYLFIDGLFYWTMGNAVGETIIINRCKPEDYDIVFLKRGTQNK